MKSGTCGQHHCPKAHSCKLRCVFSVEVKLFLNLSELTVGTMQTAKEHQKKHDFKRQIRERLGRQRQWWRKYSNPLLKTLGVQLFHYKSCIVKVGSVSLFTAGFHQQFTQKEAVESTQETM